MPKNAWGADILAKTGSFCALGELGKSFWWTKKKSTKFSKIFSKSAPIEKILDPPLRDYIGRAARNSDSAKKYYTKSLLLKHEKIEEKTLNVLTQWLIYVTVFICYLGLITLFSYIGNKIVLRLTVNGLEGNVFVFLIFLIFGLNKKLLILRFLFKCTIINILKIG